MYKYSVVIFLFVWVIHNAAKSLSNEVPQELLRVSTRSYNITRGRLVHQEHSAEQYACRTFGVCHTDINAKKQRSKFQSVFEWNLLDFDYLTQADKEYDISTKTFIPGIPAPIDVDVYYSSGQNKTVFVTIPRFQGGIPVTLGTVVSSRLTGEPVIRPYPTWEWHQYPEKCRNDRMVSVYRVKIDKCNRLWVLDTGRHKDKQVCPMQILAFDLRTDQLFHKHIIPDSLLESNSILVTPIVEVLQDNYCHNTFIYVADCIAFSIIVHDVARGVSWKVSDKSMYPFPTYGTFNIHGDQFDLMDGILGMDISPYVLGQDRKLFYHALSSPTENWVSTAFLRNQTLIEQHPIPHLQLFHTYKGMRQSQSASEAIDRNGISFFGQISGTTLNCWNTATEYANENIDIVEYNPNTLQFPSGVKIIDNPSGHQELWILTSRLQKVITGKLQVQEVNFRILAVRVEDALLGTTCKSRNSRKWG